MSRWHQVQLAFVIVVLWIFGQFVLGFLWGIGMFSLGGKHNESIETGHAFGGFLAWLGALQGIWGGLYQSVMLFRREPRALWTRAQWIRDGLVAAIPITCLWILPITEWGGTFIGWLFVPISGILTSYGCAYIVNRDITRTCSQV